MSQRTIDLSLSVLASAVSMLLSWPYSRNFEFWPESRVAWWSYFATGFVLAVYIFYVFVRSLHMLFAHEMHEHAHDDEAQP